MNEFEEIADAPAPSLSHEDKAAVARLVALLNDESVEAAIALNFMAQGATGDVADVVATMVNDVKSNLGGAEAASIDDSDVFSCGFALGTLVSFMYQMDGAFPEGILPDQTLLAIIRVGYFRWYASCDKVATPNDEVVNED